MCLLLALWEAMGSPIRCLDELYVAVPLCEDYRRLKFPALTFSFNSDVYMDSVNRKMAIDMLVCSIIPPTGLERLLSDDRYRCLLPDVQSGDSSYLSRRVHGPRSTWRVMLR